MGLILLSIMRSITETLWLFAILTAVCVEAFEAEQVDKEKITSEIRDGKILPIFQVVKFPNDVCEGSSRNGTCYTAEECSTKGGSNEGACASGFGVCCVFALSCGGSASENLTYIVQSSVTALTSPCTYTICPCSTNICRIRFDFSTFVLADAVAGTTVAAAGATAASLNGQAIGDCVTDSFVISGASSGTPVICGTNTGYHMIVDADSTASSCHQASFNVGGTTATTRSWEIRVTQYACGDHDNSGPSGCLQYYTATAGHIQNFAWPPTITAVTAGVTHLENQHYDICFRRGSGFCLICYSPSILPTDGTIASTQNSFGVGVSPGDTAGTAGATAAKSTISSACTSDWIEIPDGNTAANAAIATPTTPAVITNISRFCGRILALAVSDATTDTVCTRTLPFRVGVNFDNNEGATLTTNAMADTNEQSEAPGGIVGFKLKYWQVACT